MTPRVVLSNGSKTTVTKRTWGGMEAVSSDYTVAVNGQPYFVHIARVQDAPFAPATVGADYGGAYSFVNFDAPVGGSTLVEVTSTTADLGRAQLISRRSSSITAVTQTKNYLRFTLTGPAKVVLLHNGNKFPLLLFGNPTEAAINPSDPNVIYYGPGYHQPSGVVNVGAGQTLYLHRDAVLKGSVYVGGDGATIRGRGIISGDHFIHNDAATKSLIENRGNNTTIEGVTLRGSATWNMPSYSVTGTRVSNVKVLGARQQGDDGITFVNSTNSRVSDCFVRTDDDCLPVKGQTATLAAGDVQYDDMTLWCDRARVVLLGHESKATGMASVSVTNALIVHCADNYYPLLIQPGDGLLVSNVTLSDITLMGESQSKLLQVQTDATGDTSTTPGNVSGVTVTRLHVTGSGGVYATEIHGSDSTHTVQNVAFTDLNLNGAKVTAPGPSLRVDSFATGITVA